MSQIIKINSPKAILGRTNENEIVDLNKAYEEGVYCDSPANRKLGRVGMTYKEFAEKQKKEEEKKKGGSDHDGGGNDGNDGGDWKKGLDEDSINEVEQLILAYNRQGYEDEELYRKTFSNISDIVGEEKTEKILKQEGINPPKKEKKKVKNFEIIKSSDKNAQSLNDYLNKSIKLVEDPSDVRASLKDLKEHISIDEDGNFHLNYNSYYGKNDFHDLVRNFYNTFEDSHIFEKEKFEKACEMAGILKILDGNNIKNINIDDLLKSDSLKKITKFVESTRKEFREKKGTTDSYLGKSFSEKINERVEEIKKDFYKKEKDNKDKKEDIYDSQNWKDLDEEKVNSLIDKINKYHKDKGSNPINEIEKINLFSKGRVVEFPNGSFLIESYRPKHKDDLKGTKGLLVKNKEDIGGYSNKPTYELFWKKPNGKEQLYGFDGKSNAISYIKAVSKNKDYVK